MWFKLFVLSLFLFLVVVTVKLYRRLHGELRRAGWFLALASLVLWLLSVGVDYVLYGKVEPFTLYAETCFTLLVWAVYAIFLYQARRYFTEPQKEKPNGNSDNDTNFTRR